MSSSTPSVARAAPGSRARRGRRARAASPAGRSRSRRRRARRRSSRRCARARSRPRRSTRASARQPSRTTRAALDLRVRRHGADHELVAVPLDAREPGDARRARSRSPGASRKPVCASTPTNVPPATGSASSPSDGAQLERLRRASRATASASRDLRARALVERAAALARAGHADAVPHEVELRERARPRRAARSRSTRASSGVTSR